MTPTPQEDAREELAKTPDLRAVIRADTTVQHGRVITVLDLLKTGGITKIAFGVAPIPPPSPGTPACPMASRPPLTRRRRRPERAR